MVLHLQSTTDDQMCHFSVKHFGQTVINDPPPTLKPCVLLSKPPPPLLFQLLRAFLDAAQVSLRMLPQTHNIALI